MTATPDWSPGAVAAALALGWVVGGLAAILVALPVALLSGGSGDPSPATVLAASLGFALGALGTTVACAARAEPVRAAQLALRLPGAGPAMAWTVLAALLLGAGGLFVGEVLDLTDAVAVPEELEDSVAIERALGSAPGDAPGAVDGGVVLSALGRVAVAALAAEVVLRGFVQPAIVHRAGDSAAVGITSLLTAVPVAYAGNGGDPLLVAVGIALGLVLCALRLATDSVVPGIAVCAGALAAVFAVATALPAGQALALGAGCVAAALAPAVAVATLSRGG